MSLFEPRLRLVEITFTFIIVDALRLSVTKHLLQCAECIQRARET